MVAALLVNSNPTLLLLNIIRALSNKFLEGCLLSSRVLVALSLVSKAWELALWGSLVLGPIKLGSLDSSLEVQLAWGNSFLAS